MKQLLYLFCCMFCLGSQAQIKLAYQNNKTLSYEQLVAAYQYLASTYPNDCKLSAVGTTDNGRMLYEFSIPSKEKEAVTLLINNGIHPGEPDGIDASIQFAEELLQKKFVYPNVNFVIIPVYNVDGASLQSCCTRANQNGPENQGFRGNARNLDLNRDFIKADAKNTLGFMQIFQRWQPHIFIDNHVSNGADYQYTMTLIASQHNKLGTVLGNYLYNKMEPALYADMNKKGLDLVPYVNTLKETPDSGIVEFLETPRYSTGYTSLFHCIGFVPETHMLKPYAERVKATYQLTHSFAKYANENHKELIALKQNAQADALQQKTMPLAWKLDTAKFGSLDFKGYEAAYKKSEVSGLDRLYYRKDKPFTKKVKFYNNFLVSDSAMVPNLYLIPQAWHQVIDLLKLNGVQFTSLKTDTLIEVNATYIEQYETSKRPYEGHYLHYNTKTSSKKMKVQFFAGDVLINTNQAARRFLVETLSPQATDSYFVWNFFDSMLQQKEHYSDYVFEDTAAELLKSNPALKAELERKKASDANFAKDGAAQLDFIYKRSDYYEPSHNRYPVFAIY